jgi:hypothetical protein
MQILCGVNPSEKGRRNLFQLSVDHRPPAAFILRNLPYFWSIYSSHPRPGQHLLIHLLVAGHRRYPPRRFIFSPLAAPTAPLGSAFLAPPGATDFILTSTKPIDWPTRSRRTGLAPMMTPMVTSNMGRGLSGLGFFRYSARRDA